MSKVFSDFSLHDYFYRWKIVWTVVGSIVVIFIMMRYLTFMPFSSTLFTHESSVRLFKHTAVFVFASWLIFWYVHFTVPSIEFFVINLLSFVYTCWICFVALQPEFHHFWHFSNIRSDLVTGEPFGYYTIFLLVFFLAARSLRERRTDDGV